MQIAKFLLTSVLAVGVAISSYGQGTKGDPENISKYRYGVEAEVKIMKGLDFSFAPELRYEDGFDKIQLDGTLTYKTLGCLYFGATYRLIFDRGEESSSYSSFSYGGTSYDWDTYHKYAFDITYKEKYGRFTPSFRLRYNNYSDEEITDKAYMRYRAKVDYNIKKCKFTPSVAIEAYQELEDNMLYKVRYSTTVDYKIAKGRALSLGYKFDFFNLKYENAHIISTSYKIKF